MNALRSEGTFCDVVIVVDGQEFPVHKSILSAASPYFKAMFTCNLAEANLPKVPINGVESHIIRLVEIMLSFFCSNSRHVQWWILEDYSTQE